MDDEGLNDQDVFGVVERAHRRADQCLCEIHDKVEVRLSGWYEVWRNNRNGEACKARLPSTCEGMYL